jgi:hypothetical protein
MKTCCDKSELFGKLFFRDGCVYKLVEQDERCKPLFIKVTNGKEGKRMFYLEDGEKICRELIKQHTSINPKMKVYTKRPLPESVKIKRRMAVKEAFKQKCGGKKAEPPGKYGKYYRTRIADPKEFERRSFRTIPAGTKHKLIIGCPKKYYRPRLKECKIGTEVQSVLTKANRNKKTKRNPLLMVVNPDFVNSLPNGLKKYANVPGFQEAIKKYVEFHGEYPISITRKNLPIGEGKSTQFFIKLGKAPAASYTPSSRQTSNKKGTVWVHPFGTEPNTGELPDIITNAQGNMLLIAPGKYKVKDWIKG